jgi:hypothetical protein
MPRRELVDLWFGWRVKGGGFGAFRVAGCGNAGGEDGDAEILNGSSAFWSRHALSCCQNYSRNIIMFPCRFSAHALPRTLPICVTGGGVFHTEGL